MGGRDERDILWFKSGQRGVEGEAGDESDAEMQAKTECTDLTALRQDGQDLRDNEQL